MAELPKLFIAFHKQERNVEFTNAYAGLLRCVVGEYRGCEFVVVFRGIVNRFAVHELGEHPHVFHTLSPYGHAATRNWHFYRVPCLDINRVTKIIHCLFEMVFARNVFSSLKMYRAGLPWMPDFMVRLFIPNGKQTSRPRALDDGEDTFCTHMCLTALHAGGYLENFPSDLFTPTDLSLLIQKHLGSTRQPIVPHVSEVDSMGLRLDKQTVLLAVLN